MDPYRNSLFALGALSWVLLVSQPTRRTELKELDAKETKKNPAAKPKARGGDHPQSIIYKVYFLIMGADWLQNTYLYSLYRDEYALDASLITTLFLTQFATAAISSSVAGLLADKYGRKTTCVVFCALFACSCLATIVPFVPILFAGRIFGGLSLSLLTGIFDSWVVADFRARKLYVKGCDLYRTFGTMGVVNSVAAIVAAFAGERLVWATGTNKAPLVGSVVLAWQAMQEIWPGWVENYGASGWEEKEHLQPSIWSVFKRPSTLSLVLASTLFEGSMYTLAYFWVPALKSVQTSPGELPFSYIFSSFMASALAASLTFNIVVKKQYMKVSSLLVLALVTGNLALFQLSKAKTENMSFGLFLVLGACFGLYWPAMGTLKGRLLEDGIRAKIYSIMRVPVHLFVVASILLLKDSTNFAKVFSTSSVLLSASFAAVWAASIHSEMP